MTSKKGAKSFWVIGGMTLIGVGVGLIYVQTAPLIMVAAVLIGLGLGLLFTPLISRKKGDN